MSKYEQLIEYIINEQEDKARELFHQIVVEKSREIYESLIDEQDLAEIGGNAVESMVDEITGDEEGLDEGDELEMDLDDQGDDDMDMEVDMDDDEGIDHHDDVGGDDHLEDRVMDLEDALDELKAEFDSLMGGQGEEEMGADDMDVEDDFDSEDSEEDDDSEEDADDDAEDEEDEDDLQESKGGRKLTEAEWLREYVNKIGEYPGEQSNEKGNMAGTGAHSEKQGGRNTKSPVGPGVDMGGHVVKSKGANVDPDGKQIEEPTNEYSKGRGKLPNADKFKNVPGGDAGKTGFKTEADREFGDHDTETGKLAGADGSRPINKKSPMKHIGK